MTTPSPIHVIGGGLAGSEAAYQIARLGRRVRLCEMRPEAATAAHQTAALAELVCSNSLKSELSNSAPWLLKQELRRMGSLSMAAAAGARVPGGNALTVDRQIFSRRVTEAVERESLIEICREEIRQLPLDEIVIVATGPLTSDALANSIVAVTGSERLFFYDSISPIVDAETIDMNIVFRGSRYDRSIDGTDDYLNCPFSKPEYLRFHQALLEAQQHQGHDFDKPNYFEGCLPLEELACRGTDTLRFGPMKPVGLRDPRTGRMPYAVVQLRQEDLRAGSYNLVGFQNHLKYPEQKRIVRMIPGLEETELLRYGQIHRNTYINAPALLSATLSLRSHPNVFFAGQISGVEGYVEAMATGLIAGRNAARLAEGVEPVAWPRETAHGSLGGYISGANPANYQPANITFDLLPPLPPAEHQALRRDRKARRRRQCDRALGALETFLEQHAPVEHYVSR